MVLAALGGATWYWANRLTEPPGRLWPPEPRADDAVHIVRIAGDRVWIRGEGAERPGIWGLSWDRGYGQVGPVLEIATTVDGAGGTVVERIFRQFEGGPAADAPGWIDHFAYPDDPTVLDLPWEELTYDSGVGDIPAYLFPASATTWVVFVHGRRSRRHEAFRLVPLVHRMGFPALTISYRNDPDAPASPDGRSHLGATEWQDLEAALDEARSRGAERFVLVGFSMGGAVALNLLRRSSRTDDVVGVVLEAPVLDWGPVIRQAAEDRGIPEALMPLLLPASMALARARTGIDWDEVNHLEDPRAFSHPKLLIHGADDPVVPVSLADALAAAHPDVVTYLRVPGAGHNQAWNVDPGRYEAAVEEFLGEVTGPRPRR